MDDRRTTGIAAALPVEIKTYAAQVYYLRALQQGCPDSCWSTTYERMMRAPEAEFEKLVRFLGLRLSATLIEEATQRGSFDAVRLMEEAGMAVTAAPIDGCFTRSGSIGQWKEYLNGAQIEEVERLLERYAISLDQFELE